MKHGSPYDRGSADRYYGRRPQPHKWLFGDGYSSLGTTTTDLTDDEKAEYMRGYQEETGQKDFGQDRTEIDNDY